MLIFGIVSLIFQANSFSLIRLCQKYLFLFVWDCFQIVYSSISDTHSWGFSIFIIFFGFHAYLNPLFSGFRVRDLLMCFRLFIRVFLPTIFISSIALAWPNLTFASCSPLQNCLSISSTPHPDLSFSSVVLRF